MIHALQVLDSWLAKGDKGTLLAYEKILKNEQRTEVLAQAYWSMKTFGPKAVTEKFIKDLEKKHGQNDVIKLHMAQKAKDDEARRKHEEFLNALKGKGPIFEKTMKAGEKHYKSLCFACHGQNGEGVQMTGTDMMLAPPLKGSKRVLGSHDKLTRIVLHGLADPLTEDLPLAPWRL